MTKILTEDDVKKIVESTPNIKHKALISLIWELGLKNREAINLTIGDIDFEKWMCRVGERKLPIEDQWVKSILLEYLFKYLEKIPYDKNLPLFSTSQYKRILPNNISTLIRGILRSANIDAKPSTIRRSRIIHLLKKGEDPQDVAFKMRIHPYTLLRIKNGV
jgi:integrase